MHVDFKITTWERVEFDEEHNEAVKQAIIDGKIESANDLIDFLADRGDANFDCNKLDEVDEQMTVEDNGGCSTVEVWEQVESGQPMVRTFGNGDEDLDNV
jgi:hypothetical protein